MRVRVVVTVALSVAVLAASVGVVAGLLLAPSPIPAIAVVEDGPRTLEIVTRDVVDARTLPVVPVVETPATMNSRREGTVRRSTCQTGAVIASGDAPFVIDGDPIIAFHASSPFWRSLEAEDEGDDVMQVQEELVRLGYDVETDGFFSWDMSLAVEDLWESIGVEDLTTLPLDRLVWLPEADVTVSSCAAKVGDQISDGDPLFTSGGDLSRLETDIPGEAISGERVAVLDGLTAPVSSDGTIDDEDFLTAFSQQRAYRQWENEEGSVADLAVTVQLTTPVVTAPVPSSALYHVNGTEACVVDRGVPSKVSIVASELGSTFVVADPLPTVVTIPAPKGAEPCG